MAIVFTEKRRLTVCSKLSSHFTQQIIRDRALARLTGLTPLFPLLQRGKPGRGFHSGGTFPMRSNPGQGESDIFGRPSGMRKVHAVDASIFPTVPATTITFTVMANAYRIGSLLEQYA
jgi:choline dehydrogenase-like flavoprotein